MNTNYNFYQYEENNSCYTWLNETRDWRKHIHEDLEKHDEHLTKEAESIRKNTDEAESAILSELREVVVKKYLIPIQNTTNTIQTTVNNNNSLLNTIWSKIQFWSIK